MIKFRFCLEACHRRLVCFPLCGLFVILFVLSSCGKDSDSSASSEIGKNDIETGQRENRIVPPNPEEKINKEGVIVSHALSMHSEPRYPADFPHFDYVNPDAPRGGTVRASATGTFDSFNSYARRGDAVPGGTMFYDTLMSPSQDEINVYYGLIAEKVEYSPEYDWIIFHLRPQARYQDGTPITADDVEFSFYKFRDEGIEDLKEYMSAVIEVSVLDERRIKFVLEEPDKEMFLFIGGLSVLPPQFWKDKDFSEPLTEIPLGSGAYTISKYSMGQYVVWERLNDYWALDLPLIKGRLNFQFLRYDMYRDQTVQLEALKSGDIDYRSENVAKQWATQYTGPNFDAGYIVKGEFPDETPSNIQRYVYNIRRKIFSDVLVRRALSYLMDFEWLNKNLFYSQYTRTRSYFQGTPFEAMGLPDAKELEILEPIRNQIPPEVFTAEYQPVKTEGSGNIRPQIRQALETLKDAGWEIQDNEMTNNQTGEKLEFEVLIGNPTTERILVPFQENLKKIGVTMNIRTVDTTQYLNRIREHDYDMISWLDSGSFYPGSGMPQRWHSDFYDSFYNTAGTKNPALDYLLDGMIENLNNNQELVYWARALDRVFQWKQYGIFQWYSSTIRFAYWDKFGRPDLKPKYSLGFDTWWIDKEKSERLPGIQ